VLTLDLGVATVRSSGIHLVYFGPGRSAFASVEASRQSGRSGGFAEPPLLAPSPPSVSDPGEYPTDEFIMAGVVTRESEGPKVELGVISLETEGLEERLDLFVSAVETAIKASLDGRKIRHMKFEWHNEEPGTPRLDRLTNVSEEESQAKFVRATLDPEHVAAAETLRTKLVREILIELSEAGFARERDVLNRRSKLQDKVKEAISHLKDKGLITTEYLLECRGSGGSLTRVREREQLEDDVAAAMRCPSCGRSFSEELLSEGYSVSGLGQQMIRKSHWMTVWVTALLTKLGIPEEAILWNVSENSEEVDLLIELLGQVWTFELKDREFASGDAYALNYRRGRYEAAKTVIVTAEKMSKDAKKVFKDLQNDPVTGRRVGTEPVYVEGLENAPEILRREVSSTSRAYAFRRVSMLGRWSGYNLPAVLAARFRQPTRGEERAEIESVVA
jgi:hypothetical protein